MIKKIFGGAFVGLLAAVMAISLSEFGALGHMEAATWQWRVARYASPAPTTDSIRIIALDQKSLDWGSRENSLSWPWPRQAYEVILAFCKRAGVKVVAFDILFSEESVYGKGDDRYFARAVQGSVPVVMSLVLSGKKGNGQWPAGSAEQALEIRGLAAWLAGQPGPRTHESATFPIPEIAASADFLANISARPDSDGVFRRGQWFSLFHKKPVPSLGLAAFLAGSAGKVPVAVTPGTFTVGERQVAIDDSGASILRFRGKARTIPTVSAAAVIQSELLLREGKKPVIDPKGFAGRYVFFGLTAPGLFDLRTTPIDGVYPGIEVHATMLDNLLNQDIISMAPRLWGWLVTALVTVLGGIAICCLPRLWHSILLWAALAAIPIFSGMWGYEQGYWLPVAVQEAGLILVLAAGLALNFATEGRKKRYIKRAFGQYLHPAVIDELVRHPERLRLGGEKRELTVFFADLEGFTSIAEKLAPEKLTALLNEFLSAMTDIILESGGTIDKYEGDAILAFWNAPLAQPDHAERGVGAAIACQQKLAEMRADIEKRYGCRLRMRIGLNTGHAVVGNLGSSQRFDYTILGDAVNLASRLEGVNKEFGTQVLVSAATRARLADKEQLRWVGRVAVVGRKEPVMIYEPVSLAAEIGPGKQRLFALGIKNYYEGDFAKAEQCLKELAGKDPVAARYMLQCREYSIIRPVKWRGVWELTAK